MRIGVISDTHLSVRAEKLPDALIKGLAGVELILHAGDWVSPHVVGLVERIAPVEAVAGNNDGAELIARFGRSKLLNVGGVRIGLVHGDGVRKTTEERARETFLTDQPDIVVFGHSHVPFMQQIAGMLMLNPGSPTDKRWQPRYSYGLIELGADIRAWHEFYDDRS